MTSEFKRALDALGLTPTEYARAVCVQVAHCGYRARGQRDCSREILSLMWALAEFKTGGAKLRRGCGVTEEA